MTDKEKDLLLKTLSSMLPYGVMLNPIYFLFQV